MPKITHYTPPSPALNSRFTTTAYFTASERHPPASEEEAQSPFSPEPLVARATCQPTCFRQRSPGSVLHKGVTASLLKHKSDSVAPQPKPSSCLPSPYSGARRTYWVLCLLGLRPPLASLLGLMPSISLRLAARASGHPACPPAEPCPFA